MISAQATGTGHRWDVGAASRCVTHAHINDDRIIESHTGNNLLNTNPIDLVCAKMQLALFSVGKHK